MSEAAGTGAPEADVAPVALPGRRPGGVARGLLWAAWIAAGALLLACIAGYALGYARHIAHQALRADYLRALDEQEALARELVRETTRAAAGIESAFATLHRAQTEGQRAVAWISRAANTEPEAWLTGPVEPQIDRLAEEWTSLAESVELILSAEQPIVALRQSLESLANITSEVFTRSEALRAVVEASEPEPHERYLAGLLMLLSEQLARDVRNALDSGAAGLADSGQYGRDAKLLSRVGEVVNALLLGDASLGIQRLDGDEPREILEGLGALYRQASRTLQAVVSNRLVIIHVRETAQSLTDSAERIPSLTAELRASVLVAPPDVWLQPEARAAAAAGAVVAALLMTLLALVGTRARVGAERREAERLRRELDRTSESHERSRASIARLRDEVAALAAGDLSVQATVGAEDADDAGALGSIVNEAVETVRDVVARVQGAADDLVAASQRGAEEVAALGAAAGAQGERIGRLSGDVEGMSDLVGDVAHHAVESVELARQSAQLGAEGAAAVREAFGAVDAAGETQAETVARLRQLAERAQDVGHVVTMLDEVAEQTSLLALNVLIQASRAGESGHAVAGAADELQQLAESGREAARRLQAVFDAFRGEVDGTTAAAQASASAVRAAAGPGSAVGAALDQLARAARGMAEGIERIAVGSEEHSERAAAMMARLAELLDATLEARDRAAEGGEAMAVLSELAGRLRAALAVFRPSPADPSPPPASTE